MSGVAPLTRALLGAACAAFLDVSAGPRLERIQLPPGFRIALFADGVENARGLALSPGGVVYVGSKRAGTVVALVDDDGDGRAERRYPIARGLDMPVGVAFYNNALFVTAVSRILRFDDIDAQLQRPPPPVVVRDDLPADTRHGWRYLRFGPDQKMYVPIGAPCNVCEREGYALILRMNPDGSEPQTVARGVRNSVGFDWHPETGELWFTDNGRDWLGDDQPADELNRVRVPGQHFGFPYCHGGDLVDPDYNEFGCEDFEPPAMRLGAHVASLGMRFYNGRMFPPRYRNRIFIAEHGSWNRSRKSGYRITQVAIDPAGRAIGYEVFATGWLQGQRAWGRPVDLLVMPDGALLVSDDQADAVYRISYRDAP